MSLAEALTQIRSRTVWIKVDVVDTFDAARLLKLRPLYSAPGKDESKVRVIAQPAQKLLNSVDLVCKPKVA
jgi:hypothetical protein